MLNQKILQSLTTSPTRVSPKQMQFCFGLSIAFAIIYGILALKQAFAGEYVVQDDARQHIFWMQRFLESSLFPNDLIANYYQSVAPPGYVSLYKLLSIIGINPMVACKLLPPILGIIITIYAFLLTIELLPIPLTGLIATLMLNQNLWLFNDLSSATPRAFFYPLILAFLYYLAKKSIIPCLVILVLQGLFYPPTMMLCGGLLCLHLLQWEQGKIKLSRNHQDYLLVVMGLAVSALMLAPYLFSNSAYGSMVTATMAQNMPEFQPGGRVYFFTENWGEFWFEQGRRSSIFPKNMFSPITLYSGLILPVLICAKRYLPLANQIKSETLILVKLLLVSITLFLIAHLVLFKLYLPSRYTHYSFRIILALASAIALTIIVHSLLSYLPKVTFLNPLGQQISTIAITTIIGILLIFYPSFSSKFPDALYYQGKAPSLYEFLSKQPQNITIASLSLEADNLPAFTQRSILVSRESAIPYHTGYYQQFRQRVIDLIQAQYSDNLEEVKAIINHYQINFWLLDKNAFTPEYLTKSWVKQYQPISQQAQAKLEQGMIPALAKVNQNCQVLTTDDLILIDTQCL